MASYLLFVACTVCLCLCLLTSVNFVTDSGTERYWAYFIANRTAALASWFSLAGIHGFVGLIIDFA